MELRDLIVTPIVVMMVYIAAYLARPWLTDRLNRKYFIPALTLKIVGAIALGMIYQFYYHGGDTYNFHTHGSRHIWEAFVDSPTTGIEMMFSNGEHKGSFFKYSKQIYFFSDQPSFFIIRIAAIGDIFTFSAYSATAVLFAVFSFIGAWLLFVTFYRKYPELHPKIALATLFIPSVIFWGSGILKDTIVVGALGIATFELDRLFTRKKVSIFHVVFLILALYLIFSIKKFVLQAYIPAVILWIYTGSLQRIQSAVVKILIFPLILGVSAWMIYFSVVKVGEGDVRYSIDKLSETARTTAIDIRYLTGRDAGSGYSLGALDGTFSGMIKLAPQAINVSLFRPYLWEVRNPLMLLSALESIVFLLLVIYIAVLKRGRLVKTFRNPDVVFTFVFSIVFAFAVGISTYNFGTLARYKIPLLPFFLVSLILMLYLNNDKKLSVFEETE